MRQAEEVRQAALEEYYGQALYQRSERQEMTRKLERYRAKPDERNKNAVKAIAAFLKANPEVVPEVKKYFADYNAAVRSDLDSTMRMAEESEKFEKRWQALDIQRQIEIERLEALDIKRQREIKRLERKAEKLMQQQQDQ